MRSNGDLHGWRDMCDGTNVGIADADPAAVCGLPPHSEPLLLPFPLPSRPAWLISCCCCCSAIPRTVVLLFPSHPLFMRCAVLWCCVLRVCERCCGCLYFVLRHWRLS